MAAITFATIKTRVALNAGNLKSTHPQYTYLGDHVNDAGNAVILMAVSKERKNFNLFPELRNRRWHDVTVVNQGYLDKPATLLVLDTVTITRVTTSYDPSRHTEYPVIEEPDQSVFGTFDKASTTIGWPTRWCEASDSVLFWPTPTTAYLTRVVLRGVRREATLSANGDTFEMSDIWHPAIIEYATHLTMMSMERYDGAEQWLKKAERRIEQTVDVLAAQKRLNRTQIRISGSL